MKRVVLFFSVIVLLFASNSCVKEYTVSVYGIVSDSETHEPVEGVTVSLHGKWMETNADGYYELNDLIVFPKTDYIISTVGPFEYRSESVNLTFSSDERREVNIGIKKK